MCALFQLIFKLAKTLKDPFTFDDGYDCEWETIDDDDDDDDDW